jgi:pilus assembly protein CpaE
MLDALSLKDTKLGLETLELMGCDLDRILLVLNRADSKVGISREDAATILGREPDVLVPSDRDIPRGITEGRPIVLAGDGSAAARSFRGLAAHFLEDELEPATTNGSTNGHKPHKRRGPLSALLRRR